MRWNQSIQTSGADLVFTGSPHRPATYHDLLSVLTRRSHDIACLVYFAGGYCEGQGLSFDDVRSLTASHGVRLVVDASAQLPPRSNLYRWTNGDADIVLFSGGKSIRGPQTSGILLGRTDLVACVASNGSPRELTVGRPMKTSKESICGLVRALEIFIRESDADDSARYESVISIVMNTIRGIPGISAMRVVCPSPPTVQPNDIPKLFIDLATKSSTSHSHDPSKSEFYGDDVDHGDPLAVQPTTPIKTLAYRLLQLQPPIGVNTSDTGIIINPQMMTLDEAKIVGQGLKRVVICMVDEGMLESWVASKI